MGLGQCGIIWAVREKFFGQLGPCSIFYLLRENVTINWGVKGHIFARLGLYRKCLFPRERICKYSRSGAIEILHRPNQDQNRTNFARKRLSFSLSRKNFSIDLKRIENPHIHKESIYFLRDDTYNKSNRHHHQ